MTYEEPVHRANADGSTSLDQSRLNLKQGHVALLGDQLTDEAAMCLDLARMAITAARLGHGLIVLQRTSPPADRARHAHPEPCGRRTATQPIINRCENPVPKIL